MYSLDIRLLLVGYYVSNLLLKQLSVLVDTIELGTEFHVLTKLLY